ncbi:pantetheine-phosphate adenylyltransferase [Palleniella muris]|uniref:Pantetheine-phosphate adenylyltransferase n=1 Tax=Palleniella muris TaxID=3038145 RepID=A0AC61QU66_9BACT|nr:pantetheine-phosphate adenylyltransferase [Palleniella muris]TGX84210.1 pantetheine-phosphate adenylyltransferase [Palleniella muris]
MRTAIFTGTFNPFTIGHADIVERALAIFDKVVIGIGFNPAKDSNSGVEERLAQIENVYKHEPRVMVEAYSDMAADLAKRHDAAAVVKGVRSVVDYEYERNQAEYNRLLGDGLETVLFFSRPELSALSSSGVRTLQMFGKDTTKFLP